ncbi:hypothetical protein ACIGMX_38650 [Streptomyces aquilus]|uniref:hypothetical protein n=1 Tax=Streptomyces aquilus TaxID=2548456 RepID=UPI0037D8029D
MGEALDDGLADLCELADLVRREVVEHRPARRRDVARGRGGEDGEVFVGEYGELAALVRRPFPGWGY